jgi:hypothetical protein
MSDLLLDFAFKLGKVMLKLELAKQHTGKILCEMSGEVQEKILLQKFGKFWNQQNRWDRPDGLVIVTSHRLAFLSQMKTITTTTDYLSFPFEVIESLEMTKVWGFVPAIRFNVSGRVFIFTFFSGAEEMVNLITIAMEGFQGHRAQ